MFAEITEATLQALPGILDPGRDGYDDTTEGANGEAAAVGDLFEAPIVVGTSRRGAILADGGPNTVLAVHLHLPVQDVRARHAGEDGDGDEFDRGGDAERQRSAVVQAEGGAEQRAGEQ